MLLSIASIDDPRDAVDVEDIASAAHAAVIARDWGTLRLLLHPYLHWTETDGHTLRGRTRVLAMLEQSSTPAPPSAVVLRDGQIYRWRC
jgi:hypothetical protein